MAIILRLDRVMADRKMSLKELSERVGVANVNLSKLKTFLNPLPDKQYPGNNVTTI